MLRTLPCPRDGALLVAEPHHGVTVDRCPRCSGIWLDKDELEPIVEAATAAGDAPTGAAAWEKVRYLDCPRCKKQMARRNHLRASGVIVDSCPAHGTWLDGGELERLAAFARQDGPRKVEQVRTMLRAEEEETRKDLARLERRARRARPGRWSQARFDLLDLLDALDLLS